MTTSDDTALAVRDAPDDLDEIMRLADAMVRSNFFTDASTAAKATVKILAGRELGIGPVESMRSFHIVENKVEFAAEFLAQRVRQHPHYSYRVIELDNFACVIAFLEDGVELGRSRFDDEDRQRAELELETEKKKATAWAKYPRNMLFARAMSNGVAWFCPDVVAGATVLLAESASTDPDEPTVIEVGEGEPPEDGVDDAGTPDSGDDSEAGGDGSTAAGDSAATPPVIEPVDPEGPISDPTLNKVLDHFGGVAKALVKVRHAGYDVGRVSELKESEGLAILTPPQMEMPA